MTTPKLLESPKQAETVQAELYRRGSATLLASWEAYADGATDAMEAAYAAAGVTRFAAWVHETDEPMRAELERRGYTVDTTTRAMGMALDDIAVSRPPIDPAQLDLAPASWSEYLAMDDDLPGDFLSAADHAALHLLAARGRRRARRGGAGV
jgi:hypothetical protein